MTHPFMQALLFQAHAGGGNTFDDFYQSLFRHKQVGDMVISVVFPNGAIDRTSNVEEYEGDHVISASPSHLHA